MSLNKHSTVKYPYVDFKRKESEFCFLLSFPSRLLCSRSVWPDLAKFRHLATTFKNFGHFEKVHLVFVNVLSLLWQNLYYFGQIFSVENVQILGNNQTIWSHSSIKMHKILSFVLPGPFQAFFLPNTPYPINRKVGKV